MYIQTSILLHSSYTFLSLALSTLLPLPHYPSRPSNDLVLQFYLKLSPCPHPLPQHGLSTDLLLTQRSDGPLLTTILNAVSPLSNPPSYCSGTSI